MKKYHYTTLKLRVERLQKMVRLRAMRLTKEAGLDPQLLGIHPHNALVGREGLGKEKKEYEYKIDGLNRKNDLLARANNDYYRTITKLSKENITLRVKLEEMKAELKKQHAFESHIKELLKAA